MAFLDDFTVNNTERTVRHTSGTTVYSVNVAYSSLADFSDDPANMTHPVIMTAQTPTEYSLVNGWFWDDPSTHFLNGGAITTIGYANEIQRIVTTDAGTDPIASDIGKLVTPAGAGTPGNLLHFDLDINDDGTQIHAWYVRAGDGTAYSGAMTIASGTGAQTVDTSVDGEEVWANVFSFGVLGSTVNPQFYIEQQLNGVDHRIIEWVANSNFSRGNMDVLIRTQVEGTLIDGGNLLITIRQSGTTYDSNEQTITAGGRNPFALNAADDPDNLLSEYYFLFDGEAGTDIAVGDTLTADSKAWYCEVIEVAYFTDTTSGYVGVRSLNESIDALVDGDAFTSSGSGTAVVNGSAGDKIIAYDAETAGFTTIPQIITGAGGSKANLVGVDDNGTDGHLVLQNDALTGGIDFREDSTYYDLYVEDELITGATEGSADVDLATLDKQLATSGMDGKVEIIWHHGEITVDGGHSLTIGMHVTQAVTGQTGTVTDVTGNVIGIGNTSADFATSANAIDDDDSGATGANPTTWVDDHTVSKAFQQATNKNYDVVLFLENETVQRGYDYCKYRTGDGNEQNMEMLELTGAALVRVPVNGQFYLSSFRDVDTPANTYDKVGKRSAPLGTFAGGTWFTAIGIWLEDVNATDAIKFQLIDSDEVVQDPPNFVAIIQTVTVSGDRCGTYEDDGTGLVKKDTYNSDAALNVIGDTTWETDGTPAIRLDSPADGWVIVVDDDSTSGQVKEHPYKYDSFTGSIFTLDPISDSVDDGGGGTLTHTNSGRNFTTDGVLPGMIVRNVTDGSIGIVATVGTTTLTVKQLEGGGNTFESGDTVEINKLVVTYVAADTAFVPYINEDATGISVSVTVIFQTDRTLLAKVRNKGVIFATEAAATLNSTGATIPTVRIADTIAT